MAVAAETAKRYCPCCDTYTEWKPNYVSSIIVVKICENEEKIGRGVHITQLWDDKYCLLNNTGLCYCELECIDDDGIRCVGGRRSDERQERLVIAMEREMANGTFNADLWVKNFPRRVAEYTEKRC